MDECATNTDACDRPSTECDNANGGYNCDCKEGYRTDDEDDTSCIGK